MLFIVKQGKVIINKRKRTFKLVDAKKHTYGAKHGFIKNVANLTTIGMASAISQVCTKEYPFSDLISAELYEDDSSINSVSVKSALVWGIFAKRNTKKVVHNLSVLVTVNDMNNSLYSISFISKKTKTKSSKYKKAMNEAHKTLAALNMIMNETSKIDQLENDEEEYNENDFDEIEENEVNEDVNTSDPYEEIKKVKELLDMGIITQEEFDDKKKKLLGL